MKKFLSTVKWPALSVAKGFIDPISLISLGIVVVGLVITTFIVKNPEIKLVCMDPCQTSADCNTNEYCYRPATGCSVCKPKASPSATSTPSPSPSPDSTCNGTCVPGLSCADEGLCNASGSCSGNKHCCKACPSASPLPSPSPSPSCGKLWETCCGQSYPNGSCNSGLYCSNLDGGTCRTKVCTAGQKQCSGNSLGLCKADGSGWNYSTCTYGCTNNACQPSPSPSPSPNTISQANCNKCLQTNTPSECAGVCKNIGGTITTPLGQTECTAGEKFCSSGNLKICSNSGTWGLTTCSNGCANSACKPKPTPTPTVTPAKIDPFADLAGLGTYGLAGNTAIPLPQSAVTSEQGFQQWENSVFSGLGTGLAAGSAALGGAALLPAGGLPVAALMAQNALATTPWLQTAAAVATLSQLPASIYACEKYGTDSPACQYAAMGIQSGYYSDVIGSEQALQASAQQLQSVAQAGLANLQTSTSNLFNPFSDWDNFRLTNAPEIKGQLLENNLIKDYYGYGIPDSDTAKLIKYITGLDYTDPNLPDLLVNDINIIRAKYNLPPIEMLSDDPYEYQRQLSALIRRNGTEILSPGERQVFLEENDLAGVFQKGSNTIAIKYPTADLYHQNITLTHEGVHALQNKRYPSMPVELMEYEAHLATITNQNWIINMASPEDLHDYLFGMKVYEPVSWWYKNQGLIPSWINP